MTRLSRADMQDRNRARVLAAARDEFTERGFRDAKIDRIAERAELTRGAVYSNFPGKRALYFAVLAEDAERAADEPPLPDVPGTVRDGLGAFAGAWLARLPLATEDERSPSRLGRDLLPEVLADERTRRPFGQLMKLDALLLGMALERLHQPQKPAVRLVSVAEAALTTLHGAGQLAAAAPGFIEPFTVIKACRQLADIGPDVWHPPHLPYVAPARPTDEAWAAPSAVDALGREPGQLTGDGVVAILGLHRLEAVEEAVRAAPPGTGVTAVLVTSAPDELAPLARLMVADLRACLYQAFPPLAWPRLRVVLDEAGTVAAAAGVAAVSDATETAVRVRAGRMVARADGFGACHAAASSGGPGR